jgi:transcriptional repressor NrdR
MVCVYCQSKLAVTNSRPQKRTNSVWRRRACPACKSLFTTVETVDYGSLFVYNRPGSPIEPFSETKLLISVYEACKHRKSPEEDAKHLTDTIMHRLFTSSPGTTVQRNLVIKNVLAALRQFDKAAAVQYEAFHPNR